VIISAFYGLNGSGTSWNGIPVLPPGQDPYGSDIIVAHARHIQADLLKRGETGQFTVITLMDAWVLDKGQIRELVQSGIPVLHWMPVDCDPISQMDVDHLRESGGTPVAMSQFGYRKFIEAGFANTLYAPHAIDMSVFKPAEDREDLRRQFGLEGKWVAGINKSNKEQVRSGYTQQLSAFARVHKRHPDTLLSIHAARVTPTGLNLDVLAAKLGISHAVAFNDQYAYIAGLFGQPDLARWYSALDLCSNTALGGGFELALLESQACGTPVVGTDHSAMTELCKVGWKVRGEGFWNPSHQSWWETPSIAAIEKVYERSYEMYRRGTFTKKREAARQFALSYNADDVLQQYWVPILEGLSGGVSREKDRDATLARLQDAFNAGSLDAEAFGDRARRAMGAASAEDLAALVADLPGEMVAA
jgi:glycosyltransferase involved in cell wall biosynthesis